LDFLTFLVACAVAIFLFTRLQRLAAKVEPLEKENTSLRDQLHALRARVYDLETTLGKVSKVAPEQPQTVAGSAPETAIRTPAVVPTPAKVGLRAETPPTVPFVSPAPVSPTPPAYTPPPTPLPIDAAQPAARTPNLMGHKQAGEKKLDSRNLADLEERLGANWLNKIGTAAFVIGVALLLNYSMHYLGPAGKIALGYVLGATMLVTGIFGERTYR